MPTYIYPPMETFLTGGVLHSTTNEIKFEREDWSPGIWAGTEGCIINFEGNRYKILAVSFEYRTLTVENMGVASGAV